ncbi:MAG: hypothetical protein ACXWRE_16275 [Pseudobdellovibrionaceae bacterium]
MSLIIFFGGVSVVILLALGVIIHGAHHHFKELQKAKQDKTSEIPL